jgi:hypothetical protein
MTFEFAIGTPTNIKRLEKLAQTRMKDGKDDSSTL